MQAIPVVFAATDESSNASSRRQAWTVTVASTLVLALEVATDVNSNSSRLPTFKGSLYYCCATCSATLSSGKACSECLPYFKPTLLEHGWASQWIVTGLHGTVRNRYSNREAELIQKLSIWLQRGASYDPLTAILDSPAIAGELLNFAVNKTANSFTKMR